MKVAGFILSFLLLPLLLWANQYVYYLNPKDKKAYRIDLIKKEIARLDSNSNWVYYHSLLVDSSYHPDLMKTGEFTIIQKKNTNRLHIFQECTNQIYVVDLTSFQLKRQDETYYRGDNCSSYRFFRGDLVYSIGGYGFWRTNNHLIYFDKKTKEWEAVNSYGESPEGIYHGFVSFIPEKDVLVTFSNYHTDVNHEYGKLKLDNSIYQFSFFTKSWKKLGEVTHPEISKILEEYSYEDRQYLFFTGKYFVFESPNNTNGIHKYYFINPRTLEVFSYDDLELKYSRIDLRSIQVTNTTVFKNGPWVLTVLQNQNTNSSNSFILINFDDLAKNARFIGFLNDLPWYKTDWFYGLILFSLVALLLIFTKNLKLSKGKKEPRYTALQESKLELENSSLLLLKSIMDSQQSGGMAIEEVNRILEIDNLAFDTQRYRRSAIINQINQTLTLLTGEKNTIVRINSEDDRRQKRYKINSNCLEILRKKLKD